MKQLCIVIALSSSFIFGADIIIQPTSQVEIKFIDPETKQELATGTYPLETIEKIPFFAYQLDFLARSESEKPLTLSYEKDIFDKLINLNPTEPLPQDLNFESSAQLIDLITMSRMSQLEEPSFKNNFARHIAAELSQNAEIYSKNIPSLLQYKVVLDNFFKNNELSEAISNLITQEGLPDNIAPFLHSPYKHVHTLSYTLYPQFCLSADGHYFFHSDPDKSKPILYKRDLATQQIMSQTPSLSTLPEDHIIRLIASDNHVAALFSTGKIIIFDQKTLQVKYNFSLKYISGNKEPYLDIIPGDTSVGLPKDRIPEWSSIGFFLFSPDGAYVASYSPYQRMTRLGEPSRGLSILSPIVIIDTRSGSTRSFWPRIDHPFEREFISKALFDQDSKKIYYIVPGERHRNPTPDFLHTTHVDPLMQESFQLPKLEEFSRILFQTRDTLQIESNKSVYACNVKTKTLTDIDESRRIKEEIFRSQNKLNQTQFNDWYSQNYPNPIPMTDIDPLILSDTQMVVAASNDNAKNRRWRERSPRPADWNRNSIYLNDPNKIQSFVNPTKGIQLLHKSDENFHPETVSFNKKTFAFSSNTEIYVFQKQPSLPFEIVFGILCFQRFGDIKTLGPLRKALLPSIEQLSPEIKPIIRSYFDTRMMNLARQALKTLEKPLPVEQPVERLSEKPLPAEQPVELSEREKQQRIKARSYLEEPVPFRYEAPKSD